MMRRIRVLNITLSFCLFLVAAGCGLGDDPDCVITEDCNDGVYCNGYETCVFSICVDGQIPCGATEICDEINDECVTP